VSINEVVVGPGTTVLIVPLADTPREALLQGVMASALAAERRHVENADSWWRNLVKRLSSAPSTCLVDQASGSWLFASADFDYLLLGNGDDSNVAGLVLLVQELRIRELLALEFSAAQFQYTLVEEEGAAAHTFTIGPEGAIGDPLSARGWLLPIVEAIPP